MPLQYHEYYNGRTGLTIGVNRLLFSEQSEYQLVEVYETDTWGNLMIIDGMVMLSEKDEFVYHEMIAHAAVFGHPAPGQVLIIGGGDGGTAREVLKHPSVQSVDLVEIDETVVRAAKLHMSGVGDFDNPRLKVHYEDGVQFIDQARDQYDIIIIDSTDPVGPAVELFTEEFYRKCDRAMTSGGVLTAQIESPWASKYHEKIREVFTAHKKIFNHSDMYLAFIPLYPAGMWAFARAAKNSAPLSREVVERVNKSTTGLRPALKYFNSEIYQASFALPNFVRDIISAG